MRNDLRGIKPALLSPPAPDPADSGRRIDQNAIQVEEQGPARDFDHSKVLALRYFEPAGFEPAGFEPVLVFEPALVCFEPALVLNQPGTSDKKAFDPETSFVYCIRCFYYFLILRRGFLFQEHYVRARVAAKALPVAG
jgi:hypothetical protein